MPKVKYLGGATGAIQVDELVLNENGEEVEVSAEQLKRLQTIEGAQLEIDEKSAANANSAPSTPPVQVPPAPTGGSV